MVYIKDTWMVSGCWRSIWR